LTALAKIMKRKRGSSEGIKQGKIKNRKGLNLHDVWDSRYVFEVFLNRLEKSGSSSNDYNKGKEILDQ
jgi:hypothetical protein